MIAEENFGQLLMDVLQLGVGGGNAHLSFGSHSIDGASSAPQREVQNEYFMHN